MKDNKLPRMSNEERKKAWQELKEGDTLVCIEWNDWLCRYTVRHINIARITPKGYVRLENGILIKSFESCYYIITCELNIWIRNNALENQVFNLFQDAIKRGMKFKNNLTYEYAKLLKEILERTLEGEKK